LSITEIQNERAQGKSLATVAESYGISKQTMINQVAAQRTSALDKLKADNQISAAQYEACLANMQQRLQSNLERTDIGPNKGQGQQSQRGGMGRMQGKAVSGGMGFNQGTCPYLNAQP
jgi:DNA-binding CsgD family transcriptional regulator